MKLNIFIDLLQRIMKDINRKGLIDAVKIYLLKIDTRIFDYKYNVNTHKESYLKDLVEHQTQFAGRAIQQIYHVDFFNQVGALVAECDSWCFRARRRYVVSPAVHSGRGGKYVLCVRM